MAIKTLPSTTNFNLKYDDSNSQAQTMAQAIANVCETEFAALTGWFNITTGFGTTDRITMTVQAISKGGANNFGYQSGGNSAINVNFLPAGFTNTQAGQIAPMMFVNELVEIFMDFNNQKTGNTTWVAGHSDGEGLSQFCGILRFPVGHYQAYPSWANSWLSSSRPDWVTSNESTDGDAVSFGCSLLFLFYLNTQLGFTPAQIIQNGASTLTGLYTNLTGDSSNPFGLFATLINTVLPGTSTITSGSGQALDDPFPIFTFQFWDNKNTFGKSEVSNSVATNQPFLDALLLVLEGCSPAQWQALGSPVPAKFTGAAAGFPGITFNRESQVVFENPAVPKAPQRIHFHYDGGFGTSSPGGFTNSPQTLELDSSMLISGQTLPALTELTFYGAQDPFFSNISSADNVPWLSEDMRVFAAPANRNPVPGGPAFSTDSLDGARSYLKALLPWLTQNYGDPGGTDPFDPASNVVPGQTGALTGDSSVLPNLSFLGFNENIYNFAIARVRLDGAVGAVSKPVKVFFRLWSTQSPDTDYQPNSTYDSHLDSNSLPDWPLPDSDSTTFPFFASGNTPNFIDPNNPEFGSSGINNQAITISHSRGQWTYFGCLLNVYDSSYLVNGTPVTQLLPGTHHCLVAQIAYDDAPIVVPPGQTVSPMGGTDKLAQRNLQITPAFNPGKPPTNRVPQTFDIRPSAPGVADFDELMIEWGNLPVGSVASIYWPGASADQVIQLANGRYGYHHLKAVDPNTIQTPVVAGLTYVPIPPQGGARLASLLTVEMPPHVVAGQSFTVVVRRVTTFVEPAPPIIQSPALGSPPVSPPAVHKPPVKGAKAVKPPAAPAAAAAPRAWRYITGAFQVDIPVQTDKELLPYDGNTLAIFKWRLSVMPSSNRWYPVLQRYISYLSDRINGLGGNASGILPSPTGLPLPTPEEPHTFCGKVIEVVYDCFGDFEGFVLGWCKGERKFRSRERGVEMVALRALRERELLEVVVCEETGKIERLILRA